MLSGGRSSTPAALRQTNAEGFEHRRKAVLRAGAVFGEEGLIGLELPQNSWTAVPVPSGPLPPRERTVVTLNAVELLELGPEHLVKLYKLAPQAARKLLKAIHAHFISTALSALPFYCSLPDKVRRDVSAYLEVRLVPPSVMVEREDDVLGMVVEEKPTTLFRQGEPGHEMYMVLWGKVQVWGQHRLGVSPHTLMAEYSTKSPYPWFGESIMWVVNQGRAGTARILEETLVVVLRRPSLAQFHIDVPAFRALAMSISASQDGDFKNRIDPAYVAMPDHPPHNGAPKYLEAWVRIVGQLMSAGEVSVELLTKVSLEKMRTSKEQMKGHMTSMEWAHERIYWEEEAEKDASRARGGGRWSFSRGSVESTSSSSRRAGSRGSSRNSPSGLWAKATSNVITVIETMAEMRRRHEERTKALAKEQEAKMMDEATRTTPGDTRCLAETAARREWRGEIKPKYQVRAEMLRRWAEETPSEEHRRAEGKGPHAWLWRDIPITAGRQKPREEGEEED